jgi:sulfoxide reductase heme-binding subunit YedZ
MLKGGLLLVSSFVLFAFVSVHVFAANNGVVEYGDKVIVDSDLDGLTDEGEKQIYGSDPQKNDSDGDGFSDGAEVLGEIAAQETVAGIGDEIILQSEEIPWAWYVSRMSALAGFALLYISMVFGLAIRIPSLRNLIGAKDTFSVHCWISLQAILLALIHGVSLIFDKFIEFSFVDVFIPFVSGYKTHMVALGVIAFYLMLILIVSSYLKNRMPYKLWRTLHFLNILLYVFSLIHAWQLGTDLSSDFARAVFVGLNSVIPVLIIWHVVERIRCRIKKTQECEIQQ